jgi:DnaJ-class molecular chaperone
MKKTLYDFLGVRRDASRAEIEKAYDQMQAMYGGANGAELAARNGCSMPLIEEAFSTLSNPSRREVYDASLQRAARRELEVRSASTMEAEPRSASRSKALALLAIVALAFSGWYIKFSNDARAERFRREGEIQRIEAERLAVEAEAEKLQAQREQENQRMVVEERRQSVELSAAMTRFNADRSRAEMAETMRADNERRMAEREKAQREAMERQRLAQEQRQRQIRDEQDRQYLDSFDRRNNQVYIYQLPRR